MRLKFTWGFISVFELSILFCATSQLAAQNFGLPTPMKTIPVQKLDFDPDAGNSCVSVEGPEIALHDDGTTTAVPDKFTSCAITLFAPLLDGKFKGGTNNSDDAIAALTKCSNPLKHMIIVGHGDSGLIATGNGTNPHRNHNQSIEASTKKAIESLRSLSAGADSFRM